MTSSLAMQFGNFCSNSDDVSKNNASIYSVGLLYANLCFLSFFFFFFLIWAILKVFIEFVTILFLFYLLVFWPQGR